MMSQTVATVYSNMHSLLEDVIVQGTCLSCLLVSTCCCLCAAAAFVRHPLPEPDMSSGVSLPRQPLHAGYVQVHRSAQEAFRLAICVPDLWLWAASVLLPVVLQSLQGRHQGY